MRYARSDPQLDDPGWSERIAHTDSAHLADLHLADTAAVHLGVGVTLVGIHLQVPAISTAHDPSP